MVGPSSKLVMLDSEQLFVASMRKPDGVKQVIDSDVHITQSPKNPSCDI